jgi:hypothetical protein
MEATLEEKTEAAPEPKLYGLLIKFTDVDSVLSAAAKVRDAGYTKWDVHTPFPVHGMDKAMGIKPTILPWIVLCGGLSGGTLAMTFQWWVNNVDYPQIISGKPFWGIPANIPIGFELTILFSVFASFFGVWTLCKLPRFHHPVFNSNAFARATDDSFFIAIEAQDPKFDYQKTTELAHSLGGDLVEEVND